MELVTLMWEEVYSGRQVFFIAEDAHKIHISYKLRAESTTRPTLNGKVSNYLLT